jgi:hypothetical protein
MRVRGADHAHVQLMRKRNIGGEPSGAGDKRPVLKPHN